MTPEPLELIVHVHQEDDGSLWAEVLDLPGCFASGENLDELREALEEAISLYLTDDPGRGKLRGPIKKVAPVRPRAMEVREMRVKLPA